MLIILDSRPPHTHRKREREREREREDISQFPDIPHYHMIE
jgi:hypothetical protein